MTHSRELAPIFWYQYQILKYVLMGSDVKQVRFKLRFKIRI